MYERFVERVADGRTKLDVEAVKNLADGRPYSAEVALAEGLVDWVGYSDVALDRAKARAGLSEARAVRYAPKRGLLEQAMEGSFPGSVDVRIPDEVRVKLEVPGLEGAGARFLYLWQPGLESSSAPPRPTGP
jgi:protease-4